MLISEMNTGDWAASMRSRRVESGLSVLAIEDCLADTARKLTQACLNCHFQTLSKSTGSGVYHPIESSEELE